MSCTRWAGTPSACRRRTRRRSAASIPAAWTRDNIDKMREELQRLGLSLDWSREFATCDPDYYGGQQAIFLKLLKRGLVYQREGLVNWDPVDMTVLANEQVIDGRGWRSDAPVERRKLKQWFLRITDYADDLLAGLDTLDRWPDKVRLMQRNWIGKSQGLRLTFRFAADHAPAGGPEGLDVYTTRPDTLYGASFLAVAPDHPLTEQLAAADPRVGAFVERCRRRRHVGGRRSSRRKSSDSTPGCVSNTRSNPAERCRCGSRTSC